MRPEYPPVTSNIKSVKRTTNVSDHEVVLCAENPSSEEVVTRSQPRCLSLFVKQFDLQLFKRPTFYLLVLTFTFHSVTFHSALSFLAPYGAVDVGMSELEASFLPTAVAAGEIISKILYGCFFEKIPKSKQLYFMISQLTLVSAIFFILPFTSGYVVTILLSVTIGLFGGGVDGAIDGFIVHWFGDQLAAAVYGYTNAISFVVNTGSSILIGTLVDFTKKLSSAFYVGSVSYLLAAITLFIKQKFWN
ncbi:monocarboxylate transporter 5-like isoform X2 [Clavelina lepadiformis]